MRRHPPLPDPPPSQRPPRPPVPVLMRQRPVLDRSVSAPAHQPTRARLLPLHRLQLQLRLPQPLLRILRLHLHLLLLRLQPDRWLDRHRCFPMLIRPPDFRIGGPRQPGVKGCRPGGAGPIRPMHPSLLPRHRPPRLTPMPPRPLPKGPGRSREHFRPGLGPLGGPRPRQPMQLQPRTRSRSSSTRTSHRGCSAVLQRRSQPRRQYQRHRHLRFQHLRHRLPSPRRHQLPRSPRLNRPPLRRQLPRR